jgi:hypothetical protein
VVKYWDSSALVPLMIAEAATPQRHALLAADPEIATWWGSSVECASALHRLDREHGLGATGMLRPFGQLRKLAGAWREVQPSERLRLRAVRLLGVHPLRAADALQLAAALTIAEEDPGLVDFVCGDGRLAEAARREGFAIL